MEQLMDEQAGMELTDENVDQVRRPLVQASRFQSLAAAHCSGSPAHLWQRQRLRLHVCGDMGAEGQNPKISFFHKNFSPNPKTPFPKEMCTPSPLFFPPGSCHAVFCYGRCCEVYTCTAHVTVCTHYSPSLSRPQSASGWICSPCEATRCSPTHGSCSTSSPTLVLPIGNRTEKPFTNEASLGMGDRCWTRSGHSWWVPAAAALNTSALMAPSARCQPTPASRICIV